MNPKLTVVRAGFTNVYFLEQNGKFLLVDTSSRGQAEKIIKSTCFQGQKPEDLIYIFLTHSHYDHAGSVAQLKSKTGAKVILHESELKYLKDGFATIPKGTNTVFKIISRLGKMGKRERKIGWYESSDAEIVFNETLSLEPFGFDAEIIHTPGHTEGSSSLIVGDKAIVGDAMFNMMGSYYPGFANDEPTLKETWKKLFALDVKWYYPSHGKRISKEKVMAEASKRKII